MTSPFALIQAKIQKLAAEHGVPNTFRRIRSIEA